MKHIFNSLLLLVVAFLLPATALASQRYQFESDCVYYKIIGNEAMVTCMYDNSYYDEDYWVDSYSSDYSGFVVIPETVNYNGVTYPVTAIDSYTFYRCRGLTSVTIPNSITSIGEGAFYGCSGLTSVTIPNSVTNIGNRAFVGCSELTSIDIPNSVTTIGSGAFVACYGLTSIDIPNSVTTIGSGAFDYTAWYDNQPNGVVYAGYVAYCYKGIMPEGTIISLKYGTVGIANEAFACDDPEGDYSAPHAQNRYALCGINLPNTLKVIGAGAFEYCYRLTSINIPNSVTSIGSIAFYDCELTSITIGKSVTSIGDYAFGSYYSHEENLTDVFCFIDNPSIVSMGYNLFDGRSGARTLHVPFGTKSAYQAIPNWRYSFGNIVEMDPDTILATSIDLNQSNAEVNVGGTVQLTATVMPEDATDKTVTWASNEESVATVDENGLVTAVAPGTATITVTTNDGSALSASCSVTVLQNIVLATSIDLNQSNAELSVSETVQLSATVLPENATDKTVTWISSDESIAMVDNTGMVTAIAPGTATITAMTTDGSNLSASCQVTVTSMSDTNMFVIQDAEVLHGDSITIPIELNNDQTILAFQTDIYLPEGFSIATNQVMEPIVTPSRRLTNDHVMMTQNVSNGAVRVMCYTPNAMPIEGNEGDLFYITVQVPEDAAGEYAIYLRNSRLTTADYTELRAPDAGAVLTVKTYIPGDVNDSRSVNVADIVATAMHVMEMEPSPFIFDAADMNADGEITVTDIMLIARLILYPEGMNAPRHAPAFSSNYDRMSDEVITTEATRKVCILLDNEMDYSAFQFDLALPEGLTASNFQLTDRAGDHVLDVNTLTNGKTRVLCYTPAIQAINGHEGAVLTFDVATNGTALGDITVDGIELVTTACEMVRLNAFTIGVNNITAVNEVATGKTVARVDYYNVAGQRLAQPEHGVTLQVTTFTDGTRTTTKLIK